ncbi:MAG: hypothetical protein SGBAC_012834 [Bacillariaceae sp.]
MSSRLKLLPKKSYCPWSEENVLKVLRDEEKHAREVEAATQRDKNRSNHRDDYDDTKQLVCNGHFSLFAKEEKQVHIDEEKRMKEKGSRRKQQQQHRRPFDQSTSAAMDAAVGLKSRQHKHSRRDAAVKNRLDPMTGFCQNEQDSKNVKNIHSRDASHDVVEDRSNDRQHSKSERRRDRNRTPPTAEA